MAEFTVGFSTCASDGLMSTANCRLRVEVPVRADRLMSASMQSGNEPILVYEIDRNKSLEQFYQMAKTELPAAIRQGGVCESIACPGTSEEIVEWAIHWGSSFVKFQNRPVRMRLDDWFDDFNDKFKSKNKSPSGS